MQLNIFALLADFLFPLILRLKISM